MFKKKFGGYFIILLLPMFIVSTLLNLLFTLNMHEYVQINWFIVALLAIILDAIITWMQARKEKEGKSESN